jgi:hypothetical protein
VVVITILRNVRLVAAAVIVFMSLTVLDHVPDCPALFKYRSIQSAQTIHPTSGLDEFRVPVACFSIGRVRSLAASRWALNPAYHHLASFESLFSLRLAADSSPPVFDSAFLSPA